MRIPATLTVLLCLSASLTPAISGQNAPAASQTPACDGVVNIFRVSEITAGGSMEKFMAAVAAQQNWYKSHGLSDVIFAAQILTRDPQTHAGSYSQNEVATYHYMKPNSGAGPAHDAAWDAFVKMFADTSTIKEAYTQCVPTAGAPASLR